MRDDDDPDSRGPRPNTLLLQILAFAAIYVIWGSTYLAIRVGVRSLPPFLMAGCRFVTAGSILYAILRARGVSAPTRAEWGRGALAGLLMLTAGNGLVTWAETRIESSLAALLIAGVPVYVALLDWLRPGGVAPERRVWIGISLGGIGMALLVMRGGASGHESSGLAVAALLLSGLSWAAGSLYSRYGAMNPNPLMAAAQQMIAGGSAQLLLAVALGEPERMSLATLSGPGIAAFGYLTLIGSLVAFSAFGWLVKTSTPARLSTTAYVNPVVAVILGWALLGETLAPRALAGAALIVCSVAVMTLRLPFRRPAEARSRAG
ncbi:MAG TPA: EamA family transporter [Polyangia bacterium]|nr:EamA family transporter [Polyangia bacterium]